MDEVRARDLHGEASDVFDGLEANDLDKRMKTTALPQEVESKQPQLASASHPAKVAGWLLSDSNSFKLQIEELLRKVQPSYEKRMARISATLQALKQTIENIPDKSPLTVSEAEEWLMKQSNIRVPFPQLGPEKSVNYTFSYARPANVNVVGSFARQTAITTNEQLTIDVAVTMPSKIFQEKDYLNYRYFHKRAYYIARIAAGIKQSGGAKFRMEYAFQNDNHLQPILILTPDPNDRLCDFAQSKCRLQILLAADIDLFSAGKTAPDKACLRLLSTSEGSQDKPTPFYNATLRSECCSLRSLRLLHRASCESEAFKNACVLGSVWLRQRGFGSTLTFGGFGSFEWAYTVALLMQGGGPQGKPKLSKRCDSLEIFKLVLECLSIKNLVETPILIGCGVTEIHVDEVPMIFDCDSGLNILFKMSPWSYSSLRHEATWTLKSLNDPFADHLDACFIIKADDPIRRFDCLANFKPDSSLAAKTLLSSFDAHDTVARICLWTYRVLVKALGDRVDLVTIRCEPSSSWAISALKPPSSKLDSLLIGLLFNTQHVNRTVDRGPPADEKQLAADFREFWGEKAELRRFNDGSIRESLIWSHSSGKSVLEQILTYTLRRNLGHEAAESLLMLAESFKRKTFGISADSLVPHRQLMAAYEVLNKQIRALEDMPLQIRHISLADAKFCNPSQSLSAKDGNQFESFEPANVLVQFEGSPRWPDELAAIQRTKIALILKLGELLEASIPASRVSTRFGLEGITNGASANPTNNAFLDVSYSSGALFRLRIHHERELSLLENAVRSAVSEKDRELAAASLIAYKRDFVQSPLHTQAVHKLSTRFPALSSSTYLMKTWRDSQLLFPHICDELIELLTIRCFTQPYPWAVPGSAVAGFLRTLTFISNWDWRFDPLIIDFSGEMGIAEYDAIATRFTAWRKIDPGMNRLAMFVASNYDAEGTSWTRGGPSKVVAARLTRLAKVACREIDQQGTSLQAQPLFTASLVDYDFILYLKPWFTLDDLAKKRERKQKFKNIRAQNHQQQLVLSTVAIRAFLDELRTLYGSNVLFFHDDKGGSIVGGLWNPQTRTRSWKVNVGYSTMAIKESNEDGGQILLNQAAILHDIAELGGDLISSIEERQ